MKPNTISLFENISDNTPHSLKSLLNHPNYNIENGEFMCPLGLVNNTELFSVDIGNIPHMLIGGTTGSGKTAFIQTLLISLITQYSSVECKFIIFDSKTVDYMSFNGIPHLLIPIINDPRKASAAIHWAHAEGQKRLHLKENTTEYNKEPHIFIFLDDFADISIFDDAIESLYDVLRIGRATKIHCIISTGLPLAKIIPSELKIFVPCRIAFSTVSKLASRIIIDENGAELLEAPGEMLFRNHNKILKCRCAHITDTDMQTILNQIITTPNGIYNQEPLSQAQDTVFQQTENIDFNEPDSLFEEAGKIVIQHDKASIGMIQRYLRIGFNRASRIIYQLEDACVISSEEGTKPRKILMSLEEFEKYIHSTSTSIKSLPVDKKD